MVFLLDDSVGRYGNSIQCDAVLFQCDWRNMEVRFRHREVHRSVRIAYTADRQDVVPFFYIFKIEYAVVIGYGTFHE